MNVYEFCNELCIYFKLEEGNKKHILDRYAEMILQEVYQLKHKYDYEKLLKAILNEYTFKTFPPFALIKKLISTGIVYESSIVANDGEVIVMITPDNRIYDFVVTGYGSNLVETQERLKQQYKRIQIRKFPKGTTILKDRALIPVMKDNVTTIEVQPIKFEAA